MNRLKGLRESKNLTVMQFIEEIRQIAPTMTATQWIAYERRGIVGYNDNFWQMIADFFSRRPWLSLRFSTRACYQRLIR
ncbi:TPA: hypothetical protein ACGPJK_001655 [Streptococcus agalactiae]